MAKVREVAPAASGEHRGCLVRGRTLRADGKPITRAFEVSPMMGGFYNGAFYSGASLIVQPDAEGKWEIRLPPSSALGAYVARMGRVEFELTVPDAAEVEFDQIAKKLS
jgi:hypothetical protein